MFKIHPGPCPVVRSSKQMVNNNLDCSAMEVDPHSMFTTDNLDVTGRGKRVHPV